MKRRFAAVLLAATLLLSAIGGGALAADTMFTDVKSSDWYADAVIWAVDNNITSGTSATTFSPNGTLTRAQAVTFLWRLAGSPRPSSTARNSFTDIRTNDYFYNAVLWAQSSGITSGVTSTLFAPKDPVTRGQAITFLYRYSGQNAGGSNPYVDVDVTQYYYLPICWATATGITGGASISSDSKYKPNDPCTRATMVTFLYRLAVK